MHVKKVTLTFICTLGLIAGLAQQNPDTNNKNKIHMMYQDVYPVYVTKDLGDCKEFYTKWFNFQVVFESTFFMLLVSAGEKTFSIGFLNEVHPSSPPDSPAMNAHAGVFLTLQVSDVKSDFERLKKAGLKMHFDLKDEPWGQRRFGVVDPNGMYLDIVEQIEPQAGFWDKYLVKD